MFAFFLFHIISAVFAISYHHLPILTAGNGTLDPTTVASMLASDYPELDAANIKSFPSPFTSRSCKEKMTMEFYLKSIELVDREFVASECRTNLNDRFVTVLHPTPYVHESLHPHTHLMEAELIKKLLGDFSYHPEVENSGLENLNYDLECLVEFHQLSQVLLKERGLHAEIERVLHIPQACGFEGYVSGFNGKSSDSYELYIPLSGFFECHNGKSSTCYRTNAQSKNPRYRLMGHA